MTDATRPSLLPCPFCGGEAKWAHGAKGEYGQVTCKSNDCFGPITTAVLKADSIVQWNTRAPTSPRPVSEQRDAVLEEAAKIADQPGLWKKMQGFDREKIAASIRALKGRNA